MFRNKYVKRRVDSSDAKPCFICYAPTTCVMVNEVPESDFFYTCEVHLSDPGFAKLDAEYMKQEKEKEENLAKIKQLKAEWEAKQKKKEDSEDKAQDKPKKDHSSTTPASSIKRKPLLKPTYELNEGIFNIRLNAKKAKTSANKTKSLLDTPGILPSVPTHKPK